jgi:hypothetical protein
MTVRMTKWVMLPFLVMCLSGFVTVQSTGADNRYCGPGNEAQFGKNDGPATLPQSCFYTALSATPANGKVIRVAAGNDLQAAINKARCGDTLELDGGSAFRGNFDFPAKGCDDSRWIVVRTRGQIPPEGTRITPCYAGVSSLPGRPRFNCSSATIAMARIAVPNHGTIHMADHYRLIGLEITRQEGGGTVYNLITANNAQKIILDRVWVHGTDSEETVRGIAIPGASYLAVIDSYFSDFHCIAKTGTCVDSQAIWGGVGDVAGGTYKIVNNYLEAGAEGVMFGGGAGTATSADIEVRRNHFYKPLTWQPGDPRYRGIPFIVKNNFELKNGVRVLVEGNVLENSWGGYTQVGFQILLTPKSQQNQCPDCIVHDVTIRYCVLRHSGSGMQLAAVPSATGGRARGLFNVSIHDVTLEDISAERFEGNGFTFQLSSDGTPFDDISIQHVTVPAPDRGLLMIGGPAGGVIHDISFRDNIFHVGKFQAISTGGGPRNCAYQKPSPKDIMDSCWRNYEFSNNVLVEARGQWPAGNFLVKDLRAAGVNASSEAESLRLAPSSQYRGKSKDGRDIGADVSAIESATASVDR